MKVEIDRRTLTPQIALEEFIRARSATWLYILVSTAEGRRLLDEHVTNNQGDTRANP